MDVRFELLLDEFLNIYLKNRSSDQFEISYDVHVGKIGKTGPWESVIFKMIFH